MTGKRIHLLLPIAILWVVYLLAGCQAAVEPAPSQPEDTSLPPTSSATAPVTVSVTAEATAPPTAVPSATAVSEPQDAGDAPDDRQTLDQAGIKLDLTSPVVQDVAVETAPAYGYAPEHGPRYLAQPVHTILHLQGYPSSRQFRVPQITLYPVEAYARLTLDVEREVEHLQALLSPGSELPYGADGLPYLPVPHAVQILHAKGQNVAFQNGEGIRYVTQYVQDVAPVISSSLFYTYQGLTADGQFWVSATLPVTSEALPEDIPTAQEEGFDSLTYNFDPIGYETYLAQQQALVDSLPGDAFTPNLATLDALIQSLDLSAYEGPDVEPWAPDVAPAPDQVLDAFFEAYLSAGGFPVGAHRDNADLHPDFVAQIEETIAAYHDAGIQAAAYDPILMSQLGPAEVGDAGYGFKYLAIGRAGFGEQTANVLVERHWHYTHAVSPLHFTFTWNGERWQISGVTSAMPATPSAPQDAPVAVTEQFMALMTASTSQFDFIDEWLRDVSPHMVLPNATLALCNQSWPVGFTLEGSFSQPAPLTSSSNVQEEAYVVVHLPFPNLLLTTHLVRQGDVWQVGDVVCGDTPQGRALAFYAWYLGAAANAGETRWAGRAPNIDGMNPGQRFVTERFLREAQQRFREDPYLPSARVPHRFVVRPGAQENIVLVDLEYLGETEATVETLRLTFERQGELWLVDNVEQAPERK